MINFVVVKWGDAYAPDYVNVLHRAIRRNVGERAHFICVTDNAVGLDEDIEVRVLPDLELPPNKVHRGRWQKLLLFKPGLLTDLDLVIYLDLDVLVVGPLDEMISYVRRTPGLMILREWNPTAWNAVPVGMRPDRGGQSSAMAWRPSEQGHLFTQFEQDLGKGTPNDQMYVTRFAHLRSYFPPGYAVSFKRSCVWHYPLNLFFAPSRAPKKVPLVVFHGLPRPLDVAADGRELWGTRYRYGRGPVGWVRDYWNEHLASGAPRRSRGET